MKKKTNSKQLKNYLDFIPVHNEEFRAETDEQGAVAILMENRGCFNAIAQKIFKKPKISYIHLDEMGSFIWPLMDGQRTVYDIAELVRDRFGDKADPLYDRLVQYMRNLESYQFIQMKSE